MGPVWRKQHTAAFLAIFCLGLAGCSPGPTEDFDDLPDTDGPLAPLCEGEVPERSSRAPGLLDLLGFWRQQAPIEATSPAQLDLAAVCQFPGYYGKEALLHRKAAVLAITVGVFDVSGIRAFEREYEECSLLGTAARVAGGDLGWSSDHIYTFNGCQGLERLTGSQRLRYNDLGSQIFGSISRTEIGGSSPTTGRFHLDRLSDPDDPFDQLLNGWTADQLVTLGVTRHTFEFESLVGTRQVPASERSIGQRGQGSLRYAEFGPYIAVGGRTAATFFNRTSLACYGNGSVESVIGRDVFISSAGALTSGSLTMTSTGNGYPNRASAEFGDGVVSIDIDGVVRRFYVDDILGSPSPCEGFFHQVQ